MRSPGLKSRVIFRGRGGGSEAQGGGGEGGEDGEMEVEAEEEEKAEERLGGLRGGGPEPRRPGWAGCRRGGCPLRGGPKAPATEEHRRRLRRRHRREGLEERRGPEGRRAEGGREGLRGGDLPPSPPSICTPLLEAPPPGRLQVQRPKIFAPPEAERCASLPSAPSPAHKETGGFFFPGGGCSQKGK